MHQDTIPTPLARAAMRALPASVLQRMIDTLLRSMRSGHPKLFENLERLPVAVITVAPTDLPHCFRLAYGKDGVSLTVVDTADDPDADASIKGKLDTLLSMLEGRSDGDMLFFSRGIEIFGSTSVIVALRNTLDREEIDLMNDISALFGPFARPVRTAVTLMDKAARRVRAHIVEIYDEESSVSANAAAAKKECDRLRDEIHSLKTRLSKLEVHRQKKTAQ